MWTVIVEKYPRTVKIMVLTFSVTETWLTAQGDEAKTVELAPSGFTMK